MLRIRHPDVADEGSVVSREAFEPYAELGWVLVDDEPSEPEPEIFEVTAADAEAAAAAEAEAAGVALFDGDEPHPIDPPDGDLADGDPEV